MAKYDARLTLATVEGLSSRISLMAHQIGTSRAKAFAIPLDSTRTDYERQRMIEYRAEALRLIEELDVDIRALRKTITLMERNAA